MLISVSFTNFKTTQKDIIKDINKTSADFIHIDLFDGKFVPTKQQLPGELSKLDFQKKLDVHLMAENPLKYLDFFASLNTEYFTFHFETVKDIESTIYEIKSTGLKVGVALMLTTNPKELYPYLHLVDQVLVMSVKGGYGGSPFNEKALTKIAKLKAYREEHNLNYLINVDGSINDTTIDLVKEAGVDMVVCGSYICLSDDLDERINNLR